MTARAQCSTCRFWLFDEASAPARDYPEGSGFCRRNPPKLIEAAVIQLLPVPQFGQIVDLERPVACELETVTMFPATGWESWCGQHQTIEPSVPLC